MKQIHVTTLTKFNKCPWDYMYNKEQAELKNTYKGDILNTAVLSMWPLWPWAKFYAENIDSDIVELEKLKKVILEARAYAHITRATVEQEILKENKQVWYYQETKMVIPYSDKYQIVGSVDFVWNSWQDVKLQDWSIFRWWVIEDFKYSTWAYYDKEHTLVYDCQRIVYPLMLMNYMGLNEVLFRFAVWDKSKTVMKYCGEQVMTREYCTQYLDKVMKAFEQAENTMLYPNCNTFDCFYCWARMRAKGNENKDDGFIF